MRKIKIFGENEKINNLTFVAYDGKDMHRNRKAIFLCDCGNQISACISAVVGNRIKSCRSCGHKTHGMRKHPLYIVCAGIKSRCTNPTNARYANYGGCGVMLYMPWYDVTVMMDWFINNG